MKNEQKEKWLGLLFVAPCLLLIILFVAYPIIVSVLQSLHNENGLLTLKNFMDIFTTKGIRDDIIYTLNVVLWTTFISISIAYIFAIYLTFVDTPISRLLNGLYLIPRFIPGIVVVFAMIAFVRDTGTINRFFLQFGIDLKINLMYTSKGLIITNLWFNIPFATMLISAGLADIPPSIIESASDVGASKLNIFKSMIFPLSVKSVLISITFVFMSNISSFTTPYLMGGNAPRMLGVELFNQFSVYYHFNEAAALSVFMFILSALIGALYIYTSMKEKKWS